MGSVAVRGPEPRDRHRLGLRLAKVNLADTIAVTFDDFLDQGGIDAVEPGALDGSQ
jgi:hypothetical protein